MAVPEPFQILRHVEIGFVERQWLDDARIFSKDRADLQRDFFVDVKARLHKNQIRTFPAGGHGRHCRTHAEFSRFIARSRHDAALALAADRDWLAAQFGAIALLDRGVEGVHVDMDDPAQTVRRKIVQAPAYWLDPNGAFDHCSSPHISHSRSNVESDAS